MEDHHSDLVEEEQLFMLWFVHHLSYRTCVQETADSDAILLHLWITRYAVLLFPWDTTAWNMGTRVSFLISTIIFCHFILLLGHWAVRLMENGGVGERESGYANSTESSADVDPVLCRA
ncbi:unnamed protein product [Periconia digitata]|uniref:Uncharacterized protein n=1 Tax=Periconia digitata TaxID=1303443 RepID=A0A9W4URN4_9PLEO|nr:unnamed protein product [Periconia digitata]